VLQVFNVLGLLPLVEFILIELALVQVSHVFDFLLLLADDGVVVVGLFEVIFVHGPDALVLVVPDLVHLVEVL